MESQREGITVVVPTFDRADLLALTLRSVREQTLPATEVIVVDDGSTDGTLELLDELGVTTIVNEAGGWGPSRARNAGLERVSTEYVAFLDSDDLLLPDAFARLGEALDSEPAAPFAFGEALIAWRDVDGWHPDGLIALDAEERQDLLGSIYARNSVPSPGTLARTEAARAVGGYDPDVVWSEDHHLWVRLCQLADPVHVPEVTCVYRVHTGNRHVPSKTSNDADAFAQLAASDRRLAPAVPQRLGVQLCDIGTSALRGRRPGLAAATARRILAGRRDRGEILGRARRHLSDRRRWHRAGLEHWESAPGLRSWLSTY